MRKILLSFLFIGCFAGHVAAQFQLGYGINPFYDRLPEIHNAAFIPLHSVPSLSLLGTTGMSGFDHHPASASLLCSGFMLDRLGAICRVNYDQAGLSSRTDAQMGMAYYVFLNKKSKVAGGDKAGDKLSFSLSGHYIQDKINRNDILVMDPNDPDLLNITQTSPKRDASAGIAFLRENKYYAGLSVYQMLGLKTDFKNAQFENLRKRHYYLQGGYTIDVDKKSDFNINFHGIITAIEFTDYRAEAGVSFNVLKALSVGLGWGSNGSMKFDAGFRAQSWEFGYACGYGFRVDATEYGYTYKGFQNGIFVRKLFNEGRRSR